MEFIDLKQQYAAYKEEIDVEIGKVLTSARFIGGPVIKAFEEEMAEYTGAEHAIGCSSGTDAILLGLLAKNIGSGDEVIVPDFTFIATAEVVSFTGATPVLVDVDDDTLNIDPDCIAKAITEKTKGVIAVSLYGQCADFGAIQDVADEHGLWVMEDAAQSFGASYQGKPSCGITELATTSFFPAKPLGAYGDGGAVFTSDEGIAGHIRMLLNHGQEKRYRHAIVGLNARLDALQAAVLRVKLRHFDEEMKVRQEAAGWYSEQLCDVVRVPEIREGNFMAWAQYTVRSRERDRLVQSLNDAGIPTAVHYPIPLHKQRAYANLPSGKGRFPVSKKASDEVFSLPMHPFLKQSQVAEIAACIKSNV